MGMTTPFDQCSQLNLTGCRTGRFRSDKPNRSNVPRPANAFADAQLRGAKLFLVVDRRGHTHHFAGWEPMEINEYLEKVLKVSVRVNFQGIPYIPAEMEVSRAVEPEGPA
jgi:hypothetical protein